MGYHKINRKGRGNSGNNPMAALVRQNNARRQANAQMAAEADMALQPSLQPNKHSTEVMQVPVNNPSLMSVVDNNDLDEMLQMADLADKDYTAERDVVVVSSGRLVGLSPEQTAKEAAQAREEYAASVTVPRRPPWTKTMSADELDYQERHSFLSWRRKLAEVEADPRLMVTPFEKNLEVWRQLWRVLERSDLVVQVLDARDPLLYRCQDLEAYVYELSPHKRCLLLLNKADLLPAALRLEWAKRFDALGVKYAFWSAVVATEGPKDGEVVCEGPPAPDLDVASPRELAQYRCEVLGRDGLLARLEEEATAAMAAMGDGLETVPEDGLAAKRRCVAGFVGYPNVGKSSTLNALVGVKKASVAATPGKTKHFQTLNLSETFTLCDSPGLVFPQYSTSKAEMVLAGVLSLDRITEMNPPVDLVASRVSRVYLENLYGLYLPKPAEHEDPHRKPKALEVLRALAASRGMAITMGRPDEARAGRMLLKDWRDGKILCCRHPPTPVEEKKGLPSSKFWSPTISNAKLDKARAGSCAEAGMSGEMMDLNKEVKSAGFTGQNMMGMMAGVLQGEELLRDGNREDYIMKQMDLGKQVRAPHKFQKKLPRSKGKRGQDQAAGVEGGSMEMGKRGGIRPANVQFQQALI